MTTPVDPSILRNGTPVIAHDHDSGAQPMGAGLFIRADYNFLFGLRCGFAGVKTYI